MVDVQNEVKANELLQILAVWGVSRSDAISIAAKIKVKAADLSDEAYDALRGGTHLKPGAPAHTADNDHALLNKRRT